MEKTTLYLPDDLQTELRAVAKREGRSQAEVVRDALRLYLDRAERPRLSFIGIGEDDELRGEDVEAWLDAEWGGG